MALDRNSPEERSTYSEAERIDVIVDRFEQAWKAWQSGPPPKIADFVLQLGPEGGPKLVRELIRLDMAYCRKHGISRTLADYQRQFPHLVISADDFGESSRSEDTAVSAASGTEREPPPVPTQIGKYRVVLQLPSGGQAQAFRAIHPTLGRDVVIKRSHEQLNGLALDSDRLTAEGQVLSRLNHPALAKVHDLGIDNGHVYLVMEYIPGQTLERYGASRRLTPTDAALLVAEVAKAVESAHREGVVHQDINPRNVLVDTSERPRLIDFGLAWVNDAWNKPIEDIGGTPNYLSPEQAHHRREAIDARTDVFALGALLYYLLVGRSPIQGRDFQDAIQRARDCNYDREALTHPRVPSVLREVCLKAMQADPLERFSSAAEMGEALEAAAATITQAASKPAKSNRRLIMAAVASLVVVAVMVGGYAGWKSFLAPRVAPQLNVEVFRGDGYIALANAVPILTDEELRAKFVLPADMSAVLYMIDANGEASELHRWAANDVQRLVYYPSEHESFPLEGSPGTEALLLVRDPVENVVATDVSIKDMPSRGTWPALPDGVLVTLEMNGTTVAVSSSQERGAGAPKERRDSVLEIQASLDQLRHHLEGRCKGVTGMAFRHQ